MSEKNPDSPKKLPPKASADHMFSLVTGDLDETGDLESPPKKKKAGPSSPKKQKSQLLDQAGSPSHLVKLTDFADCIPILRNEAFFKDNEKVLTEHKFILDMKNGKLSTNRAKKFVAENYYVIKSDMRSFEVAYLMYGQDNDTYGKFFEFLRIGAEYADKHLDKLRSALKLTVEEVEKYEPTPKSHCYTSYFSWLVTHSCPAVIAACYALNYPIWASMNRQMDEAIKANPKYKLSEADTAYFRFLSEDLADMDILVKEILKLADKDEDMRKKYPYKKIKDAVRILQGFMIEFWDAVYTGAYCA